MGARKFGFPKRKFAKDIYKSQGNNPIHESLLIVKQPFMSNTQNALVYQGLALTAPTFDDGDL